MDEGGSDLNISNFHKFRAAGEGPLTLEEAKLQMQGIKRLAGLKAKKEKSKKMIQKALSPDEIQAQADELAAYNAKRAKMLEEYKRCIFFRADPLPITKISYMINNSTKEASMRIQNAIRRNSSEAKEMYNKLNFVIEARNDVIEARKIVLDNLDNLGLAECKASVSNLRCIQVKDILEEVEDYMETYTRQLGWISADM
ncbi:hypothetical protein Tco_0074124 [Tanacetum coccineum]